jgi:hypothetical protein
MLLAHLFAAALTLVASETCALCRAEPRRTQLCAAHLGEEQVALREERSIMARSKERDERVGALERVARLTDAHSNAPSPSVARFLADGLHDDTLSVRRRALRLLVDGQHREETVKGVLDGWKAAQRAWKEIDARLVVMSTDGAKGSSTMTRQELEDWPAYLEELLAALGALGDERAHRELLAVLKWPLDRTPGRFYVAAARAALQVESRKGIETVLEFALALEAELAAGRVPRRFAADGGLLSALLPALDNAQLRQVEDLLGALAHFAARKNVAAPPTPALGAAAQWRAWFKTAKDQFAERLTALE